MQHEAIIKSLIKDDLKKTKLIHSLEIIGFVNDDFDLFLFEAIIELVGIKIEFPDDEVCNKYNILLEKVYSIETRVDNKKLTELVNDVFDFLVRHKNK